MVWDIRYRSLDRMDSILQWHEFGSRIFGGIWLADSWAEAEYKGDTGMLSDFFGDHFSAAAGTAKSKICR